MCQPTKQQLWRYNIYFLNIELQFEKICFQPFFYVEFFHEPLTKIDWCDS